MDKYSHLDKNKIMIMPTISDMEYFINNLRIKLTTCTLLIIRVHNETSYHNNHKTL